MQISDFIFTFDIFSSACRVGILKDIIKKGDAAIGLLYSTPLDVWSIIGPS